MALGVIKDDTKRDKDFLFRNDGQQSTRNLVRQRGVDAGEVTGGSNRNRGRSTLEFSQRGPVAPSTRKRFREAPEFFAGEDIAKPTEQLFREKRQAGVGEIAGVKPVGRVKVGGTARPSVADKQKATRLSTFTDIGEFEKGGKTLRELATAKKGAGVFTEKGIRELFGSAADLAKMFASPEFQKKQRQARTTRIRSKSRLAELKSIDSSIKALSGALAGTEISGDEGLKSTLSQQLADAVSQRQQVSSGGGTSRRGADPSTVEGFASLLKELGLSNDEIKIAANRRFAGGG